MINAEKLNVNEKIVENELLTRFIKDIQSVIDLYLERQQGIFSKQATLFKTEQLTQPLNRENWINFLSMFADSSLANQLQELIQRLEAAKLNAKIYCAMDTIRNFTKKLTNCEENTAEGVFKATLLKLCDFYSLSALNHNTTSRPIDELVHAMHSSSENSPFNEKSFAQLREDIKNYPLQTSTKNVNQMVSTHANEQDQLFEKLQEDIKNIKLELQMANQNISFQEELYGLATKNLRKEKELNLRLQQHNEVLRKELILINFNSVDHQNIDQENEHLSSNANSCSKIKPKH